MPSGGPPDSPTVTDLENRGINLFCCYNVVVYWTSKAQSGNVSVQEMTRFILATPTLNQSCTHYYRNLDHCRSEGYIMCCNQKSICNEPDSLCLRLLKF